MDLGTPHLLVVADDGTGPRVICPGVAESCEGWQECDQTHPCTCDDRAEDDHDCEMEWLYESGISHGELHKPNVNGQPCVRSGVCWMTEAEVDYVFVQQEPPPGRYTFDYDENAAYECLVLASNLQPFDLVSIR